MNRRITLALVSGAALFGAALAAPAASAAPAEDAPACVDDDNYGNGSNINGFFRCMSGRGVAMDCPKLDQAGNRLAFNVDSQVCDWPWVVGATPTKVTAGNAKLRALPLPIGIQGLNAQVTAGTTDRPVINALVTFTTQGGQQLCTARTDDSGRATCNASGLLNTVTELLTGYKATYAGVPDNGGASYKASSGSGTVSLL
ncbi:carbohydrate-binding module family 14 protein [Streptomyces sp. NPDC094032]|uniref:carbohydrate-binding module family 14 protein n=1 Tax=Streptomyces sp. NPDC094032 TaxID=3155308 RepID=UPI00332C34FF